MCQCYKKIGRKTVFNCNGSEDDNYNIFQVCYEISIKQNDEIILVNNFWNPVYKKTIDPNLKP